MTKFKDGDKVVVRQDSCHSEQRRLSNGELRIFTIRVKYDSDDNMDYCYEGKVYNKSGVVEYNNSYREIDLELYIEPKALAKFKVGDEVVVRKDSEHKTQRMYGGELHIMKITDYNKFGSNGYCYSARNSKSGNTYRAIDLELYGKSSSIEPKIEEYKFQVGDRVLVKEDSSFSSQRWEHYSSSGKKLRIYDIDKVNGISHAFRYHTSQGKSYNDKDLELYIEPIEEPISTYKFKVGDKVSIIRSGDGCGSKHMGMETTITELGKYCGLNGYRISDGFGNAKRNSDGTYEKPTYDGFIGETTFKLLDRKSAMSVQILPTDSYQIYGHDAYDDDEVDSGLDDFIVKRI